LIEEWEVRNPKKRVKRLKRTDPGTYFVLRKFTNGSVQFMNVGENLPIYVEPTRVVKVTPKHIRPPTPLPTADVKKIMACIRSKYKRDEDGVPVMGKSKKKKTKV
jgi:hypothetical protein